MNKLVKIWLPLLLAVAFCFGMLVEGNLIGRKINMSGFRPLRQSKIDAIISNIGASYVDTVDVADLEEKAAISLLKELDPHSTYISAEEFAEMNEPLEGNFDGIGVQFNIQKDTVYVVAVIAGGPSEKVGLRAGDRIVTVGDSLIAGVGISNNDVMKLLRGPRGTKVQVGVARRGEKGLVPFEITRGQIPLYSIDVSYMLNSHTGYIKLSKFARTTYKEFQEAVAKLKAQGMQNLIFDLRGNGGGYMDAAINVVDEFLPYSSLIVYTEGAHRERNEFKASMRQSCKDLKLAVLIDEFSASASEITAGAIQDNDRGIIVGRRSFGKGLVQEPIMFPDNSSVRLTIARYYTPSGRCIQKPYNQSDEDYYADLENRYERGEFMERDSIKIADSTEYFTTGGRVVYGGGGIMPDVFIPADTTGGSAYYNKISRKGCEYQFSLEYTDRNRVALSKLKKADEFVSYLKGQNILEQFVAYAETQGVKRDARGISQSRQLIETQIIALIARNVIDNDGFYPIIHRIDKTLQQSINIVENKSLKNL
ncbi:MAG: S41 family peptidase [Salinivirgaceae bacterium]|nr:S41 family peptidase [Salinivirgaceae bacterium]